MQYITYFSYYMLSSIFRIVKSFFATYCNIFRCLYIKNRLSGERRRPDRYV